MLGIKKYIIINLLLFNNGNNNRNNVLNVKMLGGGTLFCALHGTCYLFVFCLFILIIVLKPFEIIFVLAFYILQAALKWSWLCDEYFFLSHVPNNTYESVDENAQML